MSVLFVDRFERSLRFYHLYFKKEDILMVRGVKISSIGGGFELLSDLESFWLSFCGCCYPCYILYIIHGTF